MYIFFEQLIVFEKDDEFNVTIMSSNVHTALTGHDNFYC